MLTKGDVLFALGKIAHARGSAEKMVPTKVGGPDANKAGEVSVGYTGLGGGVRLSGAVG